MKGICNASYRRKSVMLNAILKIILDVKKNKIFLTSSLTEWRIQRKGDMDLMQTSLSRKCSLFNRETTFAYTVDGELLINLSQWRETTTHSNVEGEEMFSECTLFWNLPEKGLFQDLLQLKVKWIKTIGSITKRRYYKYKREKKRKMCNPQEL